MLALLTFDLPGRTNDASKPKNLLCHGGFPRIRVGNNGKSASGGFIVHLNILLFGIVLYKI